MSLSLRAKKQHLDCSMDGRSKTYNNTSGHNFRNPTKTLPVDKSDCSRNCEFISGDSTHSSISFTGQLHDYDMGGWENQIHPGKDHYQGCLCKEMTNRNLTDVCNCQYLHSCSTYNCCDCFCISSWTLISIV